MRVGLPILSKELRLRWVSAFAVGLLTLIGLAVAYTLVAARDADRLRASTEAGNIAAAISQDIQRTIELYDLSLQGAAEQVNDPAVMALPKALRNAVLFDRAATAWFLGEIDVVDAAGDVVASSSSLNPPPRNDADRDYFRIHAQVPQFGLYVSRPLVSRDDGQEILALSRRITRPDGSFGGVVVGMLRLEAVHQLFRQIKLGQNDAIALFRKDGTLVMREPWDPALLGLRQPPSILFDLASRSPEGEYETNSAVDGVRRLFRFHRVGSLPLVADVGFSTDEIFSQSRRRMVVIGSMVAACCGLITLLLLRLGRELRRRKEAEASLRILAETDALTGLANRRCFDGALDAAWHRSEGQGASLALVMVDVDYFKTYNDTFGHGAGDEVLRKLALCLRDHAWRQGAVAARYGGEEFAIILPGLDRVQALDVAESLRRQVYDLALRHIASPLGQITISAGCAAMEPRAARLPDLVTAADMALYRAKRSGRNTCQVHPPASDAFSLAS